MRRNDLISRRFLMILIQDTITQFPDKLKIRLVLDVEPVKPVQLDVPNWRNSS